MRVQIFKALVVLNHVFITFLLWFVHRFFHSFLFGFLTAAENVRIGHRDVLLVSIVLKMLLWQKVMVLRNLAIIRHLRRALVL